MATSTSMPLQRISSTEIDPGKIQTLFNIDSQGRSFHISSVRVLTQDNIQDLVKDKLAYIHSVDAFKTQREDLKAAYELAPSLERDTIAHYQKQIDELTRCRSHLNELIEKLGVLFIEVK